MDISIDDLERAQQVLGRDVSIRDTINFIQANSRTDNSRRIIQNTKGDTNDNNTRLSNRS